MMAAWLLYELNIDLWDRHQSKFNDDSYGCSSSYNWIYNDIYIYIMIYNDI